MPGPSALRKKVLISNFYNRNESSRAKMLELLNQLSKQTKITVDDNGEISVEGDLILKPNLRLQQIPFSIKEVTGDFIAKGQLLGYGVKNPLYGLPERIGGKFDISNNPTLTSLESPLKVVENEIIAINCGLLNLEYLPVSNINAYYLSKNKKLTSLLGAPKDAYIFNVNGCDLKSLENSPQKIGDVFDCSDNLSLKSLQGGPIESKRYECRNTGIEDLRGAPQKVESIDFSSNKNMISLNGMPVGEDIQYYYDNIPNITKKTFDQYFETMKARKKVDYEELKKDLRGFDIEDF